jgi:hypothetical protein
MIRIILLLAALSSVRVPDGRYVLVNGVIGENEWKDALSVSLDSETELLAKKDARNLFLAIAFKGPRHTGVDLYIRCRDGVRMLHVSSALGEARCLAGQKTEISWSLPRWWSANAIGVINVDGRSQFLEPDAFEFQIARSELGVEANIYIHLKRPEKHVPPGAGESTEDNWLRLRLK